jgi:hypothetical protein
VVAADPQLAEEQEHLDRTYAAYDALLDALSVSRRDRQGDVFTEEVLERMRLERLRAYTGASGPLYFGRIDRRGRAALRRPPRGRRRGQRAAGDQLARAGRRAVLRRDAAEPRGVSARRRLDIEDRAVLGFVDEQLRPGRSTSPRRSSTTSRRQRVGEMRQIISTITPEQYELISLPPDGALVVRAARAPARPRSACTAPRGCCTRPQLAREGVLVVGPNRVFIAYISQVLPSLGEQSVDQRPIDALVSRRRWTARTATSGRRCLGSGRKAAALSGCCGTRSAARRPAAHEVAPRRGRARAGDVAR